MDYRDFKETVSRPFHIQTREPTDAYRDGWDRIWGKRSTREQKEDRHKEPVVASSGPGR